VAWRRRGEVPDDVLPWLYGVARNCLANTVRGRSRYRRLLLRIGNHGAAHGQWTAHGPEAEPPGAWVREALASLSESDQEVLRLTTWEELTLEEVGLALGCSTAAAGMRLHRARRRLRTRIDRMHMTVTARRACDD
jgi:RNA polymerase sigma-70 factor (ECF subfamily)